MPEAITLIPSAERLIASLRDIGYDATTAVADLVDNSIAADATTVAVDLAFEGPASWVRITDNGRGMSGDALDEALRFGSRRPYAANELGRFGLGLKTASLSQCRRLTVATRQTGQAQIEVRQWDMDHVERTDAWEALRLAADMCRPEWVEPLQRGPGTVVVWDQLDRMSSFKIPDGKAAHSALGRLCRDIEEHLAMVFHRFLAGEARRRLPLRILINGNDIEAWDPFARIERATQALEAQPLRFQHEGQSHTVLVTPYVLPQEAEFSSPVAHARAAGPNKWNHQQGFYVYRNDRMIQSGGWNRIRTPDEHTKLARIALDFTSGADAAFGINVAKMRVLLPGEIRNCLNVIASGVVSRANAAYRRRDEAPGARSAISGRAPVQRSPAHASSAAVSGRSALDDSEPIRGEAALSPARAVAGNPADSIVRILMRELSDEPEMLERVLTALGEEHPDIRAAARRARAATA